MASSLYGLSGKEIEARFDRIAAFADIGDHFEQAVKTYSSGMYVRLAFAVIAHVDADILVIDEALAVGDIFFTQKCMRFLHDFMKRGTVLFVSHDTAAVKNLCNTAYWLENGCLREHGNSKDVCEHYIQAYYENLHEEFITEKKDQSPQLVIDINSFNALQHTPKQDQRLPFINASNLRNDLRLFQFDPHAPSFGLGGCRIIRADLCDTSGQSLSWVVGGEEVTLIIDAIALQDLLSPILGFIVKDRLGQTLFGDNTFLSYMNNPCTCSTGEFLNARFSFQMPRLSLGDYSITLAIADGTQEKHIQHQWIFDAIIFRSESTSVSAGLVGIPMSNISLTTEKSLSS